MQIVSIPGLVMTNERMEWGAADAPDLFVVRIVPDPDLDKPPNNRMFMTVVYLFNDANGNGAIDGPQELVAVMEPIRFAFKPGTATLKSILAQQLLWACVQARRWASHMREYQIAGDELAAEPVDGPLIAAQLALPPPPASTPSTIIYAELPTSADAPATTEGDDWWQQ